MFVLCSHSLYVIYHLQQIHDVYGTYFISDNSCCAEHPSLAHPVAANLPWRTRGSHTTYAWPTCQGALGRVSHVTRYEWEQFVYLSTIHLIHWNWHARQAYTALQLQLLSDHNHHVILGHPRTSSGVVAFVIVLLTHYIWYILEIVLMLPIISTDLNVTGSWKPSAKD